MRSVFHRRRWLALFVSILLLIGQCTTVLAAGEIDLRPGGSSDPAPAAPAGGSDGAAVDEAPAFADPANALVGVEEARSAVVQIISEGKFLDPEAGEMLIGAGAGSGFIISPEGIAVTNNHVVTGGAIYKVYVAGEDEPRNARVLGVSECSDLAVIDIQGDDFPYLAWHEGKIKVGLEVYAAGFPLGDPEYTLTKGIVSKEKASGESNWASVDHVLQHDSNIDHGNSGGPLINEEGQVVGINYAGETSSNQFFAISRDEALPVIEQLMTGVDVDSIGLNGQAMVFDADNDLTGIFVSSVASGSMADTVGIEPGDIVVELEGIPMGIDGLMTEYCDILRSHSLADTMAIQVYRPSSGEVLEGQLNGRPLEKSFSVAEQVQEPGNEASASYDEFTSFGDADGLLTVEIPTAWSDTSEGTWTIDDKEVGLRLWASTNLKDFADDWNIPGVILSYSEDLAGEATIEEVMSWYNYEDSCKDVGKNEEIGEGYFLGIFKYWKGCGNDEVTTALVMVLTPAETEHYIAVLEVYAPTDADLNALDRVLDTFVVNSAVEGTSSATGAVSEEDMLAVVDTSGLAYNYKLVQNETISALLPDEWSDTVSDDWADDQGDSYGTVFGASPNYDDYNNGWVTPGMYVRTATDLTDIIDVDDWLNDIDFSKDCTKDKKRREISHEIFGQTWVGKYDTYTRCGKKNNTFIILAANSEPAGTFVYVDFLAVNKDDQEAMDVFLESFFVEGVTTASALEEPATPDFVTLTDDTGQISINVPDTWTDTNSQPWRSDDSLLGISFAAAVDYTAFNEGWETPGVVVNVAPGMGDTLSVADALDTLDFRDDCEYDDRYDYDDERLTGQIDQYINCNGVEGSLFSVLAAAPNDNPSMLVVAWLFASTPDDVLDYADILAEMDVADVEMPEEEASANSSAALESSASSNEEELAIATVVAQTLNVRSGPGTNYPRVGSVKQDELLAVVGQYQNCAWLQVVIADGTIGWVSGSAQYTSLEGDCTVIPEPEAPAPPPQASSGQSSGSAQNSGSQPSSGSSNPSQGCIRFINYIGLEATVTITNQDNSKAETFKVAKNQTLDKCYDPGRYTYTIDVPPPWEAINGEVRISAGDFYEAPIAGE